MHDKRRGNEQVRKGKEKEEEHWNSENTKCVFVARATDTRNTPVYSCRREENSNSADKKNMKYRQKKYIPRIVQH